LKAVRVILWGAIVVALIGIVVAKVVSPKRAVTTPGAVATPATPVQLFQTPSLTLTDQDGKSFSTAQLQGHVWVADFIFTSCGASCPIMSHEMAGIQTKTPVGVDFVSFTVDPKTDTPAILREYGQSLHADFSRWHFLTGTEEQIADAAYGMKIAVRPADGQFALSHSDRFLLVDSTGHVVGIYDGTNHGEVTKLIADATKLAAGGGKAS
jgi:protein SCO1/2